MMSGVYQLKNTLRKEMRKKLSQLPNESIKTESKLVTNQLLELPEFHASKNISIYINMSGEIITVDIIKKIFETNKNCYVPRWNKHEMEMVKLNDFEDFIRLPINRWNIPEPAHDEPRENALNSEGLDLIIMPGVAFDAKGNRLGHGKGYYDRYLTKCDNWAKENGRKSPKTVALALEAQIIESVPSDAQDKKPDLILTSSRRIAGRI
ncbi:uncharacterized protein VTP21DRAFT_6477 [Calcarisporiella thermophila]|uniref:uncharacterized protein n=1 Tax=Calcarisporiella thermophila TaxID=911321 RepID=UPI00374309CF